MQEILPPSSNPLTKTATPSTSRFQRKKVILYFYPKDDTPGCTAESCNFRDNYTMLLDKGYAVIGASIQGEASHQKFIAKYDLPFPLMADTDKSVHEAYGTWGVKKMYGKEYFTERYEPRL